jgi:hypothetical protein
MGQHYKVKLWSSNGSTLFISQSQDTEYCFLLVELEKIHNLPAVGM